MDLSLSSRFIFRLFLVTTLTWCIFYYYYKVHRVRSNIMESFAASSDVIRWMGAAEFKSFIDADRDGYIAALSPADLSARQVATSEEYKSKVKEHGYDPAQQEKEKVLAAIIMVQQWISDNLKKSVMGIDFTKLQSLPWTVAVFSTPATATSSATTAAYEGNLPHTRADVIFLPKSHLSHPMKQLAGTLLHEKIHVYQRELSGHVQVALKEAGFTRDKHRKDVPLARANPDLDDYIYRDPSNKPMMALYNSPTPKSITDVVITDPSFEHPYEKAAYIIATMFSQDASDKS